MTQHHATLISSKTHANAIRALSMDAVQAANSGHPGMPMGMADAATALWTQHLKHNPSVPQWPDRDRFVLSAGHGSMLLYSLLYLTGYSDMSLDDIKQFRQTGSKTCGHPEYGHASGIETTTGPLGQGIANAVGMALAERMMHARYGDDLVNHYTYCIVGDGCLMEGISQEAISFAAHQKLHKLIVLFDDNGITIDGSTELSTSENHIARFNALGWHTASVNGHDARAVSDAIAHAKTATMPSFIACKTTIGYGSPKKAGTSGSHGSPLGEEEITATKAALGWQHGAFDIPNDILHAWRDAGQRTVPEYDAWKQRFDATSAEVQEAFTRSISGELPEGWQTALDAMKRDICATPVKEATRKSSEEVLKSLTSHIPELLGGSADLTGSNNTKTADLSPIQHDNYAGRYIYYGIREHAMGAIMNGITLHGGFIPYSGTFLVFSDYMRTPMRLSALMGIRTIHVHTHDSIGLGEDGPTHQPVEHLAALRAIPNMYVFRPADRIETLECWSLALAKQNAPSTLALSRQNLPQMRLKYSAENQCAKGGYTLRQSPHDVAVVIASGSELHLAQNAADTLAEHDIHVRVVSMPCMELFFEQSQSYRDSVLGSLPCVAIEAACDMGWHKIIGRDGIFIGMNSFGASAPAEALFAEFGITAEAVVKAVKQLIAV
jgi:transketolase